jgi:Tfp pilus assembly protein PilF
VPGWPIGFGDDDTAEEMLRQALTMNPDGIDPNYFYGDFLAEDGRKQEAVRYLSRALNAAPRVGRPLADQGRRKEIKMRLESLK